MRFFNFKKPTQDQLFAIGIIAAAIAMFAVRAGAFWQALVFAVIAASNFASALWFVRK